MLKDSCTNEKQRYFIHGYFINTDQDRSHNVLTQLNKNFNTSYLGLVYIDLLLHLILFRVVFSHLPL